MTHAQNNSRAGDTQDAVAQIRASHAALCQARVALDAAERDEDAAVADEDAADARRRIGEAVAREAAALDAALAVKGEMLSVVALKAEIAQIAGETTAGLALSRAVLADVVALAKRAGVAS